LTAAGLRRLEERNEETKRANSDFDRHTNGTTEFPNPVGLAAGGPMIAEGWYSLQSAAAGSRIPVHHRLLESFR
jgi:hypothetical protein